MTRRTWTTLLLTGAMVGYPVVGAWAQNAEAGPDEMSVVRVDFITGPATDADAFEQLWKYLECATLRGPSTALLARNGLRMGRLNTRFRKEFDKTLGELSKLRSVPHAVQMIPGRPQDFSIGPILKNRTLFVWKKADTFIGRRYPRSRHGLTLTARPTSPEECQLTIAPQVRHGDALKDQLDLDFLVVSSTLTVGESIVVSPAPGKPTGLGAAFYWGIERRGRQRTFVVITLTGIRKAEPE